MSKEYWAHSGADAPHWLEAHLTAVGERAALNATRFGPAWAQLAGLWHDLGKYRPGFQTYIRQTADAHIEGKLPSRSDKSHSAAGALHALEAMRQRFGANGERVARLLAYVIAGHYTNVGDSTINAHEHINRKHLDIRGCWGSEVGHFLRALRALERWGSEVPWHEVGARTLAFPAISTGVYGFPKERAARLALTTSRAWLAEHGGELALTFCCFSAADGELYRRLLAEPGR